MIKQVLLPVFLLIVLASCQKKEENNYAIISGLILNAQSDSVDVALFDYLTYFVVRENPVVKSIEIKKDGTFIDTIFNTGDQVYTLIIGDNPLVYLRDGYDLKITADENNFTETVSFRGEGSMTNAYLQLKEKIGAATSKDNYLEEKKFIAKNDSIRKVLKAELELMVNEDAFVEAEMVNVECQYLYALYNYQGWHKAFTKNPSFKVSDDFPIKQIAPELIEGFDYGNEKKFNQSIYYRNFESARIRANIRELAKQENLTWDDATIAYLEKDTSVYESLEYYTLTVPLQKFSAEDLSSTNELYGKLLAYAEGKEKLENKIESYYEQIISEANRLAPGQPSPKFVNYENYEGGSSSLDDFAGKYVFIDFWATWCGPCLTQIPHLKEIEKKFHDKNIVFIGISTDRKKDREKWRKAIEKHEMGGIQLLTDNAGYSDFYQAYGISSIPRFILIDPQGNIVDADAPLPSDPKLVELFESISL